MIQRTHDEMRFPDFEHSNALHMTMYLKKASDEEEAQDDPLATGSDASVERDLSRLEIG